MIENKRIAIIMATYNGEKYIKQQLESIKDQTYKNYSLIIGDDKSVDGTVDVIKLFIKENPQLNIKLICNEQNLGFRRNFENLISNTKEEYIAFCDQDDIWTNKHLELLISNIDGYDISCADAELIDSAGNVLNIKLSDCRQMNKVFTDKKEIMFHLLHNNFVQGTAMLAKKNFLKKYIPIPDNVEFHDYWFASLASFNNGIKYINEPILLYRQHTNNVTQNEKYSILKKISKSRKKDNQFFYKKIDYLNTIKSECFNEEYKSLLNDAIDYYENIVKSNRIKIIKYFTKNYELIYFDTKKSVRFMLRLVKYLF